jgi:ABC-2 type transport system permease protein
VKRAIEAELLKVRTTRMWWGLLLGMIALVALNVVVTAVFTGRSPGPGAPALPGLDTSAGLRTAVASGFQSGYLMALVLGTIVGATDYRHRTATQTFLASPRRSRVVLAKLVAGAAFGLLYAAVAQLLSVLLTLLVGALRGISVHPTEGSVVRAVVLGLPGIVLWMVIGVALGVLLRNQIAAVLIAVGFVFLVDPLLGLLLRQLHLESVARYTLGSASSALVEATTGGRLLAWWGGGLVMLAWCAVITAAGVLVTSRRDVT